MPSVNKTTTGRPYHGPRHPWYWVSGLWRGCVYCGSRWPHRKRWCDEVGWLTRATDGRKDSGDAA